MPDSRNNKAISKIRLAENLRHIADSLSDPKDAAMLRDYAAELNAGRRADPQASHLGVAVRRPPPGSSGSTA